MLAKFAIPTQAAVGVHGATRRSQVVFQVLVLGLLLAFLVNYKGAAGISKIQQAQTTGSLHLAQLQIGRCTAGTSALSTAVAYLKMVWPALVFGILISAALRTSLSRTPLNRVFGRGVVSDQLSAALTGAPLMLCSCCAAPLFPAVYQRTRKVAPALGITLDSPSLNPAALTLSFILFPWRIAAGRLVMALLLVLIGCVLVARITRPRILALISTAESRESTWAGLLADYAESVAYTSLRTVPLILVGIWASMWLMSRVPRIDAVNGTRISVIVIVALIAVLLTLPSFFEIPLALSVLAAGGPAGAAAALLFAGPAINLPSLLVIGRHSNWKVAAALTLLVWAIAAIGGLLLG
jgi:uncharacterized membrane protein YraQ (UPF0718 family)